MRDIKPIRINYDELDVSDDGQLHTYDDKPFTGIAYEEDHGGRLLAEDSFVGGVRNGASLTYYPTGNLQAEENLQGGGLEGLCRYWYENGQLRAEKIYDKHSILVKERTWNDSGELTKDW